MANTKSIIPLSFPPGSAMAKRKDKYILSLFLGIRLSKKGQADDFALFATFPSNLDIERMAVGKYYQLM